LFITARLFVSNVQVYIDTHDTKDQLTIDKRIDVLSEYKWDSLSL